MYLILELEGGGGGGGGGGGWIGEVCPGPPICEPTIAICDSISTHFIYIRMSM